jgi:hypothetical protein
VLAEHAKTHFFSAGSACVKILSACSACVEHFLAHTQHALTFLSTLKLSMSKKYKLAYISLSLKNKL